MNGASLAEGSGAGRPDGGLLENCNRKVEIVGVDRLKPCKSPLEEANSADRRQYRAVWLYQSGAD